MKWLLGAGGSALLEALARERLLVALDFDGTLAPIVRSRGAARMRRATLAALAQLSERYPCVLISGRTSADVRARVIGAPLRAIVGNHGADLVRAPALARRSVTAWRRALEASLAPDIGIEMEDKGLSLSLHYRSAANVAHARAEVARAVTALMRDFPGALRAIEGKRVLSLLPAAAPGKARAVVTLQRRLKCARTLFVGDDVTDEDVFASAPKTNVVGVRVGRTRRSAAPWYLRDQREIDALLRALCALRGKPDAKARSKR